MVILGVCLPTSGGGGGDNLKKEKESLILLGGGGGGGDNLKKEKESLILWVKTYKWNSLLQFKILHSSSLRGCCSLSFGLHEGGGGGTFN